MDRSSRSKLFVTLLGAVVAVGASEILQRLVVEPRISRPMAELVELSPLIPLAVAAIVAGVLARSLKDGLIHAVAIAAAVVITRVILVWSLGLTYTHDMWVGDSGFLRAAALELTVLSVFLVFMVKGTVVAGILVRRLRLGV